ncbi:MAG TPA: hypothetical protein VLF94_01760 [Chlamydiales bacterium]|nr:hypothetical protein [Chlamydiales bacterium]
MARLSFFLLFLNLAYSLEAIGNCTIEELKQYISRKIEETVVEAYPFPHVVVSDILPPQVYEELVANWPTEDQFDLGTSTRRRLPVTGGCAEKRKLTKQQAALWRYFGEQVVNEIIKPQLIKKISPFFSVKFSFLNGKELSEAVDRLEYFNCKMDGLNLDRNNLGRFVHVDHAYMLGAMLIYFAEDTNHVEYGTALYESVIDQQSIEFTRGEDNTFYVSKILPYLPNTLVFFLQNPRGWHGVEAYFEHYNRKSYMAEIHLKPEVHEQIYLDKTRFNSNFCYERDQSFLCLPPEPVSIDSSPDI